MRVGVGGLFGLRNGLLFEAGGDVILVENRPVAAAPL